LDKILLTTFTENAANELKTRIRQQIKKRLAEGGLSEVITQRFNKALQNIESAPIYTIHGFCQRMAGEFAFESGQVFDQELVDGDRVREDRFNAFVRSWPNEPDLKVALQHYLSADKNNSLSRLKTTVLELAGKSNPDFDVIYPLKSDSLPDLENYSLLTDIANLEQQFLKLLTNKDGKTNAHMQKN
jgi:ATP-dependent exoDNAse (exonuclease V) beta subunit (contains helicase and exonuclease domains)